MKRHCVLQGYQKKVEKKSQIFTWDSGNPQNGLILCTYTAYNFIDRFPFAFDKFG